MTHNDSDATNEVNALVANSVDDLIRNIRRLYDEPELYKKLCKNGYDESNTRKAEVVGDALHEIFAKII